MSDTPDDLVRVDRSDIHGQGVFANRNIVAGTRIGIYEGSPTDSDGTHVLWVEDAEHWKLIEGTGRLRWLNHSRSPNSEFDGVDLYALVDIVAGDEVTFDYGPDWAGVD